MPNDITIVIAEHYAYDVKRIEFCFVGIYSSGTTHLLACALRHRCHYQSLLSISPASMSSEMSLGERPSTWQPVEKAVPRISLTVPSRDLAIDLNLMVRAISMISSRGMDLVCLMFFSFLRSRGGSLRALMTREEAEGTTETAA